MFQSNAKTIQKLKINLKLAINRLKLLEKKKTELAIKSRVEIADYLRHGKVDRAKVRVESIAREDYLVEAMELVEMFCDLLLTRMSLLQNSKKPPDDLEESVASVLWAAPRLYSEVTEMKKLTKHLTIKFGKEFVSCCQVNRLNNVNEKLINKLEVTRIPSYLIESYIKEISKTYKIEYKGQEGEGGGQGDANILFRDPDF